MPDAYVVAPIETDPEVLAEESFADLQERIPGWEPNPGNLETIALEGSAAQSAEGRDVASDVTRAIFRWFGSSLAALPPLEAEAATATATFTAQDDDGYTVEAGLAVGVRVAGDELILFDVVSDVVIAPGDTATAAGEVDLVAQDEGAAANGLATGSVLEVVDSTDVAWTAELATDSEGGADEESDDDYLDRLAQELELQSPQPILPEDFAVLARRIALVDRALAVDLYKPGTNEKQTVSHDGTGGTGTLSFDGQTTAATAWDATAALIQTRLEALSNISVGDVLVTGGPWPAAVTVEFTGYRGGANQPAITGNAGSLTPGGRTITITTTVAGAAPETARERSVTVAVVDEDGEMVPTNTRTEVEDLLQGLREVNFEVWMADPTYTTIDCTFTATIYPGFDAAEVEAAAEAIVTAYLSPPDWGVPRYGEVRQWVRETVVRVSEVEEQINSVDGIWRVDTCQLAVSGNALGVIDVPLPSASAAPLVRPGVIAGTVSA